MKSYQFTIVVQQDEEGNFLALCPALQGCYAKGETREEAISYLEDVIKKCEMENEKIEEEYALVMKKLKEESQNCTNRVMETLKEDSKKRLKI